MDQNHSTVDRFKNESKKESNKAAAKRSRLKKKNAENHNNEMRRKLQEDNSKLVIENNILRAEVERLNAILDTFLHNCSIVQKQFEWFIGDDKFFDGYTIHR